MIGFVEKSRPMKQQQGISLLEMIMAVLVVMFGIMGYVTSVNYSLKSVRLSLFSTQAAAHVQNLSELTRLFPQGNLASEAGWATGVSGTIDDCMSVDCAPDDIVRYYAHRIYCSVNPDLYANSSLDCDQTSAGLNTAQVVTLPNARLDVDNPPPVAVTLADGTNSMRTSYRYAIEWDDSLGVWDSTTNSWVASATPVHGVEDDARQYYSIDTDFYWPVPTP